MASGIDFHEVYDTPGSDNARFSALMFGRSSQGSERAVTTFDTREAAPGTKFNYAGINTKILGLAVSAATGMSLSN
jgi:CubicO group peptidase (beta-lactamase class C family)